MADKDFSIKNGIVVNTAFSANSSGLYFSNVLLANSSTVNATSFTGTSNNTTYVGSVTAANVVSNAQLTANLSSYQTKAGLSANVATLTSNNATFAFGLSSASTTATGSTVVTRDANGDFTGRYINSSYFNSSDDVNAGSVTYLMGKFGDNYYRSATAAKVASFISGQNMSIVGSATSFTSTSQNSQFNSLGVGTAASSVAGEIRASSNITAYYSDIRLKKILGTISNPLDKILSLSGIVYVNNEIAEKYGYTSQEEQVGVIAQEVEKVLPQIVKLAPFDSEYIDGKQHSISGEHYKTVQYEKIIPLLIEAIKELSDKVKELENR